jgi:hypothetical protein
MIVFSYAVIELCREGTPTGAAVTPARHALAILASGHRPFGRYWRQSGMHAAGAASETAPQ